MAIFAVTAFEVTNAESTNTDANIEKSVAWYAANSKEAHDQNKECHDNPNIQSTPECINSLHALQIKFAGGNGRR
ncbi:MAG: hypothetical protein PHD39_13485 [Methylobacter tundripaludum]|nr:hypothetical protein [Methylobacter tundripaludum]